MTLVSHINQHTTEVCSDTAINEHKSIINEYKNLNSKEQNRPIIGLMLLSGSSLMI